MDKREARKRSTEEDEAHRSSWRSRWSVGTPGHFEEIRSLGPTKVGGQEEAMRMRPGGSGRRKKMRPIGVTVGVRPRGREGGLREAWTLYLSPERKGRNREETHEDRERTCKLHTKKIQIQDTKVSV